MMENSIQSLMNDSFNQGMFKAIEKIRNKNKQQANIESIFEQIIKTTGMKEFQKHSSRIELKHLSLMIY